MYVEDLLLKIRDVVVPVWTRLFSSNVFSENCPWGLTSWHRDFLVNVGKHIESGSPLSTKQGETFLKIVDRFKSSIADRNIATEEEIAQVITSPSYRQPLYKSTVVPKEVRYIGGNLLAFRCKSNQDFVAKIKALVEFERSSWLEPFAMMANKIEIIRPRFDWLHKIWIVPVYHFNISAIMKLIHETRFHMDKDTSDYLELAKQSINKPSLFVVDEQNQVILANVCDDPILASWITEIAEGIAV